MCILMCLYDPRSRLKFSSKSIPFMNGSDIRPPLLFSWDQISTVFSGMSFGDLQAFITDQEKLSVRIESEREGSPVRREFGGDICDRMRRNHSQEPASEMELAEVALNILCLLMKEQWRWLCTENIQRTIRLLFGTLINSEEVISFAVFLFLDIWVPEPGVWCKQNTLLGAPSFSCQQEFTLRPSVLVVRRVGYTRQIWYWWEEEEGVLDGKRLLHNGAGLSIRLC
ncbi:sorting nexin-19-like isoform X2 [Notothenia coriiceps]|uniref:Sorting nexin-19-like isoform X2 n=1 Tax=Notothenia coriiceps TaxID=8208 RepID=A0A6I9PAG1_9TELE|nr:PREDICTED: sorting nexin-19-like isoform X2 [Notothenia coriiceps]